MHACPTPRKNQVLLSDFSFLIAEYSKPYYSLFAVLVLFYQLDLFSFYYFLKEFHVTITLT
jgi:hypothetical protein